MTGRNIVNLDIKLNMNAYLRSIGRTSPEERGKLRSWIKSAGTAYANPWDLYDEYGRPLDFISAYRVVNAAIDDRLSFASQDELLQGLEEEALPF